jgi:hypothetical protein
MWTHQYFGKLGRELILRLLKSLTPAFVAIIFNSADLGYDLSAKLHAAVRSMKLKTNSFRTK